VSIGRELAEVEQRRGALLESLQGLREQANENTDAIAEAVRPVFERARRGLAQASTPQAFNKFVEQFVGPMEALPDGTFVPKQMPPAGAEDIVQRQVAGGGFEPLRMARTAFWQRAA
jgi:hypothetical protein